MNLEDLYKDDIFKFGIGIVIAICLCMLLFSCELARAEEIGIASYYTYESCRREGTSGVWTASGERYNENDLTCARRSRDWGGLYKVTNLDNGKSVIVRHNDFGPSKKLYDKGRIIDLSRESFKQIANLKQGIVRVRVERVR